MRIKNTIKSGIFLVIIAIGLFTSSIYAVDNSFNDDFGDEIYDGDYLFDFINKSKNNPDEEVSMPNQDEDENISDIFGGVFGDTEDVNNDTGSDDNFGSSDIDFNSGSEEPGENTDDIFGDLLGEVEDNSNDDFGFDTIDFNAASEQSDQDIGDIFGDVFGETEDSDNDTGLDDNFGSSDIDFNSGSEEPDENTDDIFGDLLGEVEDNFNDDFGFDTKDFNAVSEQSDQDIGDIFGDIFGETEGLDTSEDLNEDVSDIFGNILGDVEDENTDKNTSTDVIQQQYPNCKAIDDMLYGYSDLNISKFIDIEESLYKNDIIRVENAGVIDGRSMNTFDPYEPITRAEFLSVAMKAHCIDFSAEGTHSFSDVEKSGWKARVVSKAVSEGIISGATSAAGKKVFRPNDAITRIEVLAILLNMTKKEIPWDRESPYIDIASQQWQKNYVTRWNELGLFMPYKTHNKFYPNRYIMREHIGTILYRVVQLYR